MNLESYRDYSITKPHTTESFPFGALSNVLVFKVANKIFTCADISTFERITLKFHPASLDELKAQYPAIQKAPYFNKKHWAEIVLDNSIPDKQLFEWIDSSYSLVISSLTKKVRTELSI